MHTEISMRVEKECVFHTKEDRVRQSLLGSVVRQYPRRAAAAPRPDFQPQEDQPDAARILSLAKSYLCWLFIALFAVAFHEPGWHLGPGLVTCLSFDCCCYASKKCHCLGYIANTGSLPATRIGRRTLTAIMRKDRYYCNKKRLKVYEFFCGLDLDAWLARVRKINGTLICIMSIRLRVRFARVSPPQSSKVFDDA